MPGPTVGELGELELVERIVSRLSAGLDANIRVGPGDDAAVVAAGGTEIVVCTDSQHEDVHFRRDWIDPRSLGRKAIAVNASDVGAMGAVPRSFVVALGLPPETGVEWVEALVDGMRAGAAEYGAAVVGGDVACIPGKVSINVTATGALASGVAPVCRAGAESTDRCWVTGFAGRGGGRAQPARGRLRSRFVGEPGGARVVVGCRTRRRPRGRLLARLYSPAATGTLWQHAGFCRDSPRHDRYQRRRGARSAALEYRFRNGPRPRCRGLG